MTGADRDALDIDTSVPHAARVYDFLLGGVDNFAVDRQLAIEANANMPGGLEGARANVRANRRFLGRAVRYLAGEAGVRQFLDIGTGVPAADNVHSVAQAVAPESRIVCADNDPIVLAHAHKLMKRTPEGVAGFIQGDLRDPEAVLMAAASTLKLDEPIDAESMAELSKRLSERSRETFVWRSHSGVSQFFDAIHLVEPGVVPVDEWRPDGTPSGVDWTVPFYGGMGRKR